MKKGQSSELWIKNILKFFKMNENTISTIMGGVVILVIVGLIFNYFRTTNLKTWQGLLNGEGAQTSITEDKKLGDSTLDTYKVVKGDDLWHIAEKYYKSGYNYVDIIKENKLSAQGTIEVGQELRIPKVEAKQLTVVETKAEVKTEMKTETAEVKKEETKNSLSIEAGSYTTVRGDSFWKIAVRAYGDGYAWTKIFEANKQIFNNPNLIHADVKIVIPSLK